MHRRVAGLLTAVALAGTAAGQPADAIWMGGNIYTLDPERPRAEALAVQDGRLIAVGSEVEIGGLVGQRTQRFDLQGATVVPGLIDAHGHLAGLGSFGLGRLDLSAARSMDDVVSAVRAEVAGRKLDERTWVLGGRWDHESWADRQLPTHAALSAAAPQTPVWLTRVDGHAGLANAAALRIAGVTRDTPDPPGGEILKDALGEPTGVLVDNAMVLVERVAGGGPATAEQLLLKAQEMCLAAGLTGVHDAGISPDEVAVLESLAADGRLKLRVYALVNGAQAPQYFAEHGLTIGERLTVRSCKLYVDGALGSRGAWLLAAYSDRPTGDDGRPYTGLCLTAPEELRRVVDDALRRGYQVCTHAIGDQGNRAVLDLYEAGLRARIEGGAASRPASAAGTVDVPDHRFRIEHAQVLALEDVPRFAAMGVIPSMQPTHCTSDMRWVEQRIGPERARGAYAWATLLRSGARIAGGSDFPVESHNPFLGLYAAVTRQDGQGGPPGGWRPEERLTRVEALRAFTLDAAYAAFEERQKGSLTAGKLADFVVLDRDVMLCPPQDIAATVVLRTVIAGEVVYSAK